MTTKEKRPLEGAEVRQPKPWPANPPAPTGKDQGRRPGRYRALTKLSLRQLPDGTCNDWHVWPKGTVFTPPPHMNVDSALERGIMEPVADDGKMEVSNDGEI